MQLGPHKLVRLITQSMVAIMCSVWQLWSIADNQILLPEPWRAFPCHTWLQTQTHGALQVRKMNPIPMLLSRSSDCSLTLRSAGQIVWGAALISRVETHTTSVGQGRRGGDNNEEFQYKVDAAEESSFQLVDTSKAGTQTAMLAVS